MDAITLLKTDHKTVEHLFRRFEKAGDRAFVEKAEVMSRIVEELSIHAAIEEQLFYPVIRATVADVEEQTLEGLEEHHVVKLVLAELARMDPTDERYVAKATVLIENVRHHVEEEERDLFPKVRQALGRSSLGELGDAMAEAKKTAPTHPHPRSPDSPPSNMLVGAAVGVVDRIADTVGGVANGGVAAVQDLVGAIQGRQGPPQTPKGNSTTRRAARRVRTDVGNAERKVASVSRAAARNGSKRTSTNRSKTSSATSSGSAK